MRTTLVAVAGPLQGATLPLTVPEISIGRDDTNQLVLADPSVSPRHSVVSCSEGGVPLRALEPANPSFINGLPAGDQPMADGDQMQIGESLFVVRFDEGEGPAATDGGTGKDTQNVARISIVI